MEEQQDQGQERHLAPTPKRRRDAAKRGNVLRSRELNTLLVTFGGALALLGFGQPMLNGILAYTSDALIRGSNGAAVHVEDLTTALVAARDHAVGIVTPILAVLVLLALAGPLLTGGITIRWSSAQPKLSNLSLIKGFKRIFSGRALMELLKAVLKFTLLAVVALILFYFITPQWLQLGRLPLPEALAESGHTVLWFLAALSATLVIIAGIDLPFQWFQHIKRLRMTRQELQDELKETEGRPEVKRRIRALQLQAAQRRLESSVPEATVVVTNPVHYAVALRYDEEITTPVVVARGAGVLALHMQTLARRHDVPIVAAPPLARALYFAVSEGREIPFDLYRVVAQVMIYVLQVGQQPSLKPPVIEDSDIPVHLQRQGSST